MRERAVRPRDQVTLARGLRRLGEYRALALLCCAGYLVAGRLAHNVYPFSVYDMYAAGAESSASQLAARDRNGKLDDVSAYEAWSCPTAVRPNPTACEAFPFYYIPYHDAEAAQWIERHAGGEGGEPVEVVHHIWNIGASGELTTTDCVVARCTARRR